MQSRRNFEAVIEDCYKSFVVSSKALKTLTVIKVDLEGLVFSTDL